MRYYAKFITLILVELLLILVTAAFIWFWAWFYYEEMFRPPDLDGIPRTVAQLRGDISYISLLCAGFAIIATLINYVIVLVAVESLESDAKKTKNIAILVAIAYWMFLFLPTLWFGYKFWMLHTSYQPPL